MNHCWLRFTLESDATFGRGDGIPGLLDQNVVLDRYGCPYLHGRTLKGLLSEVCSEILYGLKADADTPTEWSDAANRLFGQPGSVLGDQGIMRVSHARLPDDVRKAIHHAVDILKTWQPEDVTDALTTVRHQTALEVGGAPDPRTLRTVRVILRETPFKAELTFERKLNGPEQGLLAACVKGFRRAGIARNRGRGRLRAVLEDDAGENLSDDWFQNLFKSRILSIQEVA